MCVCQWIIILAKWRCISTFQYPCLVPLIFPEGICIWILAAYFFIHLLIFIFHQENFSNPFSTSSISDKLDCQLSCSNKFYEDRENLVLLFV